jgi:hypothetical protein
MKSVFYTFKVVMIKFIKFLFTRELEIAPGVFWLGGHVYENRNKPKGKPPLKLKKSDND